MPAKLHAGLAELIAGKHIDLVLLAGPEMKALAEKLADGPSRVPGQCRRAEAGADGRRAGRATSS